MTIRPKPWWLGWTGKMWVTLYPYIYQPKGEKLSGAILAHENVHLAQQQDWGLIPWLLRYVFLRSFRFEQEIVAIKAQMEATEPLEREGVIKFYADMLSSWRYLWAGSRDAVREALESIT